MSATQSIISVPDIGVRLSRNRRRNRSLRDLLFRGSLGPVRSEEFWPFRHVSFDIGPRE